MQPDHLWAALWGLGAGILIAAPAAFACAVNAKGAARKIAQTILAALAISLSNMTGCVAGFEMAWRLFGDVAIAGVAAIIGATALSTLAYWRTRPFGADNPPPSKNSRYRAPTTRANRLK